MKLLNFKRDGFLWLANFLLTLPGHAFRRWVFRVVIRNQIGSSSYIERFCRVSGRGGVSIGNNCNVNQRVYLDGRGGLRIGDKVNISDDVIILTDEHEPNSPTFADRPRPVYVGSRVWLATRSTVLPGANISDGALVAAGSIVRGDVEPNSIVAGVPARVVGRRSDRAQESLPPYRRFFR